MNVRISRYTTPGREQRKPYRLTTEKYTFFLISVQARVSYQIVEIRLSQNKVFSDFFL